MVVRCGGRKMFGMRLWATAAALHALVLTADCVKTHRRSLPTHQSLPLTKGGWRPVVGSSGLVFSYGTAPLHAPSYKIPIPVIDYQSSVRPHTARDSTKLTSIAQSYRPTTHRTLSAVPPSPAASQPISTYLNPFALPNNGLTHYKFVQNFPSDSVLIRNPHNPYAARPVFKYPGKQHPNKQQFKQQYPSTLLNGVQQLNNGQVNLQQLNNGQLNLQQLNNGHLNLQQLNNMQQLTNVQPIHFGQYQNQKTDVRKQQTQSTEIFKPEVYKLPDSDPSPQSINQQVKTAQQQTLVPQKVSASPYPQYAYQESVLPPSILGSFGSFGVQSAKARDPLFPARTTYIPVQPTKQTVFNSFSFAPNFKTTPNHYPTTTPKLQTTANQIHFGSTWNDFVNPVTHAPKATPPKIDPNVNKGINFKASPQDPFIKPFNLYNDYKVSTYNPTVQTTTFAYSNYHDYNQQQNQQLQNYLDHQNTNFNYEKKQKVHDSIPAGVNQQTSQQYVNPPKNTGVEGTQLSVPFRATYEVTETYADDILTHASPAWQEDTATKDNEDYAKPESPPLTEAPEDFAIVTEGEKGYENSLRYDGQVESQSRRPLDDNFEPIGKHKLKEYYYKVSTPSYDEQVTKRTKKPVEVTKPVYEVTTPNDLSVEPLPTLAPNKHFKRPTTPTPDSGSGENKTKKRNKIRRRRPPLANINRGRDSSTRKYALSTEASKVTEETQTIRPRVRPTQSKPSVTTPSVSTDLTTSANPTISPTSPSIVKKKLIHRRPLSTTEKYDTTTQAYDSNKESPIMKISASSRIQLPKASTTPFEYKTSAPDYSHKQDEKDTPTSDIAVDTLKMTSKSDKPFSFHRDSKPIEAKLEPVIREIITTESSKDNTESNEITTTPRVDTTTVIGKITRPRLRNKFDRPRFSVKDYRSRLSSTTSSTDKPAEAQTPKLRFPQRKPVTEKVNDVESTTERKKFMPKDPRHKTNGTELNEQAEKEIHAIRPIRRQTTTEASEPTTQKISSRVRNGSRRPRPNEETTETTNPTTTLHSKRPLRKKIKDSDIGESVQDISVTETTDINKNDITSERTRSESAIMKIADKKHHDHLEHLFEHSKRVSDLTLAASKDYNTPGMFKTVSTSSRRIPNYFTIATDDPILPIEAFFPQLNQKKET